MESQELTNDNPDTLLGSETESEPTPTKKPALVKRKKRRKERKFEANFNNVRGVHRITLSEAAQEYLGCVVGEKVTVEKPWMQVDKELIQEHLESHESSVFLPIKDEITEYPKNEMLMGYIPDESKDYDEFYICVTEDATVYVEKIAEKMRQINEERLQNAIYRKIKTWKTLGSESEVEETILKKHRSLIEVEIESKYPLLPFKIHFKYNQCQNLRDGYMELIPTDSVSTIFKKRIDAFVQVAPDIISNEAQTICTYPKNSFTQYEYEIPSSVAWENYEKNFQEFISEDFESLCDILRVNGCIDLYSNDYENLGSDDTFTVKVTVAKPRIFTCFIDMNLSSGKMISSVKWHPMWTGCAVCSYVDIAPPLYISSKPAIKDDVYKAVHDTNIVLFWSINDNLKPKLILETPRPAYKLSCCDYDPNLIIGGLVNGQIVLWDISNKLESVEQEEVLTVEQQKYREHMFSLMHWMKNIFDLALVRPTALSDLKYSHKGCIVAMWWMSPFHTITKTGKIEQLEEDSGHSLQFVTAGEDGTLLFWDLLRKPVKTPGAYKGMYRAKRLKKRPSALVTSESPFRKLHLNLIPVYKLNVINPIKKTIMPLASWHVNFYTPQYVPDFKVSHKSVKLTQRQTYKPLLNLQDSNPRKTFYAGGLEGDFVQGKWEGQDFDSGEIINFEDTQCIYSGRYHDGPIVEVDYSPMNDTVLTVGGKVFALWREAWKDRPIVWRKGTSIYTHGTWFHFEQATLRLIRIDGFYEVWTLFYQSKTPLSIALLSNGPVSLATTHPRKLKINLVGLSDYRGAFQTYYVKSQNPLAVKLKQELMSTYLTKEIERKKMFIQWQETWNKRYGSKTVQVEEEKKDEVTTEFVKQKNKEEKKKIVELSPGMRYLETVREQRRINDQQRIKSIILTKKQLNTEDLLKKREPLRKLEEEHEIKKRKQRAKQKVSGKIFKDEVSMLFPDVIKEKPPPPIDPYEDCYSDDNKKTNFQAYDSIYSNAKNYVEEHPFSHDFTWTKVLRAGRERRQKIDEAVYKHSHKNRIAFIKEEKMRVANQAAKEAEEATKAAAAEEVSMASSLSRGTFIM